MFQTARTTSKYQAFYKTSKNLVSSRSKQGGNYVFARVVTKIYGRYLETFTKFYNTAKEFVDSLVEKIW